MRRVSFLLALLLLVGLAASAQRRQYASVELFGSSQGVGLSYDARFTAGSPWAWRAGASWGFSGQWGMFGTSRRHALGLPLEVKHIFFRGPGHLELGVGSSLGLYFSKERYWALAEGASSGVVPEWEERTAKSRTFGYFLFANVGYRLERKRFLFRTGLTSSPRLGGRHAVRGPLLYPYLGFGFRL